MPIRNPNYKPTGGAHHTPISRAQILAAQANTQSARQAARYLNVGYATYKQYAKLYGVFEQHLNPLGIGTPKGFAARPNSIKLKDIFAGKHPDYSLARLRNRMVARKYLVEKCSLCGMEERRITDGKIPLIMTFIDGNNKNFARDNFQLLCYNCMFLTTGAPSVVHARHIKRSYYDPSGIHKQFLQKDIKETDYIGDDGTKDLRLIEREYLDGQNLVAGSLEPQYLDAQNLEGHDPGPTIEYLEGRARTEAAASQQAASPKSGGNANSAHAVHVEGEGRPGPYTGAVIELSPDVAEHIDAFFLSAEEKAQLLRDIGA